MSVKILHLLFAVFLISFTSCTDNSTDNSPSPVAEYTQIDFEPAWSSDANKVAYVHSNIDSKLTGIYIVNSNGTNNILLFSDYARSPSWSADDAWIAFSQVDNIFKINISADSLVQLTHDGKNYYPKWRTDDSLIAFSKSDNNFDYSIYIMKPDGSDKTLIDNNASYPGWVNINSLMYFKPVYINGIQTGDTLTEYFFNTNSKHAITFLTGEEHKVNMYPLFTGDAIIFCSMNNIGAVYIYSMLTDGSNIQKLTSSQSYSPDYSLVNQKIIYTNRSKGNGRLWIMNKDGSNKTQLTF